MGVVYLARDLQQSRLVAIKVLRPDVASALGPARFLREISIAAHLGHPHIIPVHDSGQFEGTLYYVMPYVEGETLRAAAPATSQLPIAEAVGYHPGGGASPGLRARARRRASRHQAGEHPAAGRATPLVADFGIARASADRRVDAGADAHRDVHRHADLHEPRTGGRRSATSTVAATCTALGMRALRDAGRSAAVHRTETAQAIMARHRSDSPPYCGRSARAFHPRWSRPYRGCCPRSRRTASKRPASSSAPSSPPVAIPRRALPGRVAPRSACWG